MVTRAERKTVLNDQEIIYSDFLIDLNPHPVSGDIVRLANERAVARAMKTLLLTNQGERLYNPTIGSNIRSLLFEPLSVGVANSIEKLVGETLRIFEPRAKIVNISADPDPDNNSYSISIVFYIINKSEPISFNISLTRVR